jgi:cell division septum initiation protein DivIVA
VSTADSQAELPVAFRGYDRAATDAALAALEQRHAVLAHERDELRRHVDELLRELEERRGRSQALADAFVTAQQVAADLRAAAETEGETIRSDARQEATEIVREARIRADRLIDEVVAALEEHRRDTDEFVSSARERLAALVQDLLYSMPGSAPPPPPGVAVDGEDEAPAADVAAA